MALDDEYRNALSQRHLLNGTIKHLMSELRQDRGKLWPLVRHWVRNRPSLQASSQSFEAGWFSDDLGLVDRLADLIHSDCLAASGDFPVENMPSHEEEMEWYARDTDSFSRLNRILQTCLVWEGFRRGALREHLEGGFRPAAIREWIRTWMPEQALVKCDEEIKALKEGEYRAGEQGQNKGARPVKGSTAEEREPAKAFSSLQEEYNHFVAEEKAGLEHRIHELFELGRRVRLKIWPLAGKWADRLFENRGEKMDSGTREQYRNQFLEFASGEENPALLWTELSTVCDLPWLGCKFVDNADDAQKALFTARRGRNDAITCFQILKARLLLISLLEGGGNQGAGLSAGDYQELRALSIRQIPREFVSVNDGDLQVLRQAALNSTASDIAGMLSPRQKEILREIGRGFQTYRNLSLALDVPRESLNKSEDLKGLIEKGLVAAKQVSTELPGDVVTLMLPTPAGTGVYKKLFNREPYQSRAAIYLKSRRAEGVDPSVPGKSEGERSIAKFIRHGYWIDEIRAHALRMGYLVQVERTYNFSSRGSSLEVVPDLVVENNSQSLAAPVQVEIGEKGSQSQIDQMLTGIIKACYRFNRCDVFTDSQQVEDAVTRSNYLFRIPVDLINLEKPAKAPIRVFRLDKLLRNFKEWPAKDDGASVKIIFQNAILEP